MAVLKSSAKPRPPLKQDPVPPAAPSAVRKGSGKASLAQTIVSNIRKTLAKEDQDDVSLLSEDSVLADVTEWIPTGFPNIDAILGGGWPVGRASEVYGAEGCGKSALAHRAIKACQDSGGTAMLIDFEHALDKAKMLQLGINADDLIYTTPKHIEQAWDEIWTTMETLEKSKPDAPFLLIWDSIAAAPPKEELSDKTVEKNHVGLVAKAMTRGCRRMFRAIARVRAHMLWINQERDDIGGFAKPGFMQEKKTTGGNAIKYAATLRIRVARVATLKARVKSPSGNPIDRSTGYCIKVTTKKNRLAPPHQKSEFILDFKHGPSPALTALHDLLDRRVVKNAGKRDSDNQVVYSVAWDGKKRSRAEWIEGFNDPDFYAHVLEVYKTATFTVEAEEEDAPAA